jgi:phospholipase/carboxylesterase
VEDAAWHDEPARKGSIASTQPATELDVGLATAVAPATLSEVFVPDHYEQNYAYPLIMWLGGESSPAGGLPAIMRQISDRNLVGAAVHPATGERLEDRVVAAIAAVRKQFHVHSERIFLAGVGESASQALALGLSRPEWFGGLIAISPRFPQGSRMLSQYEMLRGKRVFLATSGEGPGQGEIVETQRLLWSAGMSVRAFKAAGQDDLDRGVLREIDRWVIEGIAESD